MDYESASHGVNPMGVQNYLNDLNMGAFAHIKDALRNTTDVAAAVHNGWVGTSADNFEHNIINAGEKMCETIDQIQEMLRTEVEGIQSAILDMDANLVEEE